MTNLVGGDFAYRHQLEAISSDPVVPQNGSRLPSSLSNGSVSLCSCPLPETFAKTLGQLTRHDPLRVAGDDATRQTECLNAELAANSVPTQSKKQKNIEYDANGKPRRFPFYLGRHQPSR